MKRVTTRRLLRALAALLSCAAALTLATLFLFGTETGSGWLLQQLTRQMPGQIELQTWRGTLWRGLHVPYVAYRDARQEIQARDVEIAIDWAALSGGRLQFSRFAAASVLRTDLEPAGTPPRPLTVAFEPLALPIGIRRGRLGRLTLVSGGDRRQFTGIDLRRALLDGRRLRLAKLSLRTADLGFTLKKLRAKLSAEVPLDFAVEWGSADGSWHGHAKAGGSLAQLKFTHTLDRPYKASAVGSIALLGRAEPRFDLSLTWEELPFDSVSLHAGKLHLTGTLDSYAADFRASARLPERLTARISGQARGNASSVSEFAANVESPAGQAGLTGSASWDGAFRLDAEIQLRDFDPARIHSGLSGRLAARAKLDISGSRHAVLTVSSVSGRLNSADVGASGELSMDGNVFRCRQCGIVLGANRLDFDGEAGRGAIGLSVKIDAPDLSGLWPGLAGSVKASGRFSGNPRKPAFKGTLDAVDVSYAGLKAAGINLDSRGTGADDRDIALKVKGLSRGGAALGDFDLHAKGSLAEAAIQGEWVRGGHSAHFAGTVERSGAQITGTVERARIHDPVSGDWSLQAPFAFRAGDGRFESDPQRWSGTSGALRLDRFSIGEGQVRILAQLDGLPLQVFNPILPPAYRLRGTADAEIDVAREGGQWSGSAHWRQSGTEVTVTAANSEAVEIQVRHAEANLQFKDGGVVAKAAIGIEHGVSAEASVRLQEQSPSSAMHAELHLSGGEWPWLPAVLPFIDRVEGRLDAKLTADGVLPSPSIEGRLDWRGGSLFVPALNTAFDHIELALTGAPDGTIGVKGALAAGNGKLNVSGRIDEPLRPERSVALTLTGDDARLLDWNDYRVWASPDLTIRGDAAGWRLSGGMKVPRAEISVRELPAQATRPSPDVVVLGQAPQPEPSQPYSGEIELSLGDGVHIRAFGLDSKVSGKLRLVIPASGPLSAHGQLKLNDGVFKAYGQKLTISRGTLDFTGPLDNPLVDVRAERLIETASGPITAGLQLNGRAQNLSSTVYSDPAMSEADALSYLTLGRPLNQATNKESNEMANAAVALGLGQAGRVTRQIGHKLGLDELAVGDSNDSTALMAGKQLSHKLYARYTYGVFSRIGTLLLRYKLAQHLTLEAGAGETQTFDVLYTIEKN